VFRARRSTTTDASGRSRAVSNSQPYTCVWLAFLLAGLRSWLHWFAQVERPSHASRRSSPRRNASAGSRANDCLSESNDRLILQPEIGVHAGVLSPLIKHVGRCAEFLRSAGAMPWKSKPSSLYWGSIAPSQLLQVSAFECSKAKGVLKCSVRNVCELVLLSRHHQIRVQEHIPLKGHVHVPIHVRRLGHAAG
jgi:hypothetical protein